MFRKLYRHDIQSGLQTQRWQESPRSEQLKINYYIKMGRMALIRFVFHGSLPWDRMWWGVSFWELQQQVAFATRRAVGRPFPPTMLATPAFRVPTVLPLGTTWATTEYPLWIFHILKHTFNVFSEEILSWMNLENIMLELSIWDRKKVLKAKIEHLYRKVSKVMKEPIKSKQYLKQLHYKLR